METGNREIDIIIYHNMMGLSCDCEGGALVDQRFGRPALSQGLSPVKRRQGKNTTGPDPEEGQGKVYTNLLFLQSHERSMITNQVSPLEF